MYIIFLNIKKGVWKINDRQKKTFRREENYEIPQEDDEEIEYEMSEQGQIEQDYEEDEEESNSCRTLRKLKSIKRQNIIRKPKKMMCPIKF